MSIPAKAVSECPAVPTRCPVALCIEIETFLILVYSNEIPWTTRKTEKEEHTWGTLLSDFRLHRGAGVTTAVRAWRKHRRPDSEERAGSPGGERARGQFMRIKPGTSKEGRTVPLKKQCRKPATLPEEHHWSVSHRNLTEKPPFSMELSPSWALRGTCLALQLDTETPTSSSSSFLQHLLAGGHWEAISGPLGVTQPCYPEASAPTVPGDSSCQRRGAGAPGPGRVPALQGSELGWAPPWATREEGSTAPQTLRALPAAPAASPPRPKPRLTQKPLSPWPSTRLRTN